MTVVNRILAALLALVLLLGGLLAASEILLAQLVARRGSFPIRSGAPGLVSAP